jgi:hypothetical protein
VPHVEGKPAGAHWIAEFDKAHAIYKEENWKRTIPVDVGAFVIPVLVAVF